MTLISFRYRFQSFFSFGVSIAFVNSLRIHKCNDETKIEMENAFITNRMSFLSDVGISVEINESDERVMSMEG